jgi:hypothetical protein
MVVPAAMFIEVAIDMLKSLSPQQLADQRKEFCEATQGTETSEDLQHGYEIGLQTMRYLLATNPSAVQAHIDLYLLRFLQALH